MPDGAKRRPTSAGMIRAALLWRRHGWLIIGLLWVVALALAYVGFGRSAAAAGQPATPLDRAYLTLQLIPMNSGAVAGPVSWELQVGRFLVPFLTAWTAIRALLSVFRGRWQQFLVRAWRDHVIICGLSRKGWLLAQGFSARGDRVVVIEADESHDLIVPCRERGIVVLTGDATDPDLLRRAGVLAAGRLVAVTDDDGVNAEIGVRCQELVRAAQQTAGRVRRGSRALTCTVHVVDPQLYEMARTRELAVGVEMPLHLELFNVFERGARALWSMFGPVRGGAAEPVTGCSAHVLVIGLGHLGESLIVTAARDWHTRLHASPCGAAGRLRISVIDVEAEWKCRSLSLRYPQLPEVCDLVPVALDVRWPEFHQGDFLAGSEGSGEPGRIFPPAGAVFVCFDDDSLGLRTGLAVRQRLLLASAGRTPVVVRMAESGGLARLLDADGAGTPAFADLHAFGLLDRTCTPEAILGGTHEVLARGLHDVYIQQQRALGRTAADNPSLVDWDALPDALRESNRAQADRVVHHLAGLGYTLAPLTDWDAAFFRFSDSEVERLAESEHGRFLEERKQQDWSYVDGPKDIDARRSPALLPWADAPDEERQKTRDIVRELPATLARAGFQIVRPAPGGGEPTPPPAAPQRAPVSAPPDLRSIIARAIHEHYRQTEQGRRAPDDPVMRPWEELREDLRESSRQQADDIADKLSAIGCALRPRSEAGSVAIVFSEQELERMAEREHERWVAERRAAGWLPGPEHDVIRKISPYLVPYADLPEDVREADRNAVRSIPQVLAQAGLEVHRLR